MAELDDKVIVTKSKITDIADALREEMSESNEYSLPTMVQKVHELGQGQGSEYTGGVGIDITNRVVSVVDTLMIRGSANGSVASIDDGADDVPMKSCTVAIEPVQSGSGDPSPSNVRPITGWTECNLTRAGKNLIPYPYELASGTYSGVDFTYDNDGTIKLNGTCAGTPTVKMTTVPLKAGTYKFSNIQSSTLTRVQLYKNNTLLISLDYDDNPYTFTINDNDVIDFRVQLLVGTYSNVTAKAQIEVGSTATEWNAYKGNTYNIEFPSEAGTVYGGTLDVTNGVLTVTKGYIASYNGETLPSTWISDRDVYAEGTTPTTGAEVVYELATPITYQLDPTEVKTLLGINNIFADTGDINNAEYVRDATLIINKLLELVSGNNNRTMMKSAVVEKTDEVQEQKKDSVEEDLDA